VIASPGAIAFELGPLTVRWYGILMATSIGVGFWLAHRQAQKEGLPADDILRVAQWAVIAGLIGARLYEVAFNWDYYGRYPWKIPAVWEGGLAMHGGIIVGFLTGVALAVHSLQARIRLHLPPEDAARFIAPTDGVIEMYDAGRILARDFARDRFGHALQISFRLLDRQCIHVCSQRHDGPGFASLEYCNNAGAGHGGSHLEAQFLRHRLHLAHFQHGIRKAGIGDDRGRPAVQPRQLDGDPQPIVKGLEAKTLMIRSKPGVIAAAKPRNITTSALSTTQLTR
jgi:hypothetical protein